MAKITIKVDANDAKKKLDDVRKKLQGLGKEAKKPITPNVAPRRGGRGGGGGGIPLPRGGGITGGGGGGIPIPGFVSNTISRVLPGGASSAIGNAGRIVTGAAASMGVAGGAAAFAALAVAAGAVVLAFEDLKTVIGAAKNYVDAYINPDKTTAERAAKLDILADRARANGATNNEQFATDEARKNVFGEMSDSFFDKITQAVTAAYSGDDKATKALETLGIRHQDLDGKNNLQQQDIILKALSDRYNQAQAINDPLKRAKAMADANELAQTIAGTRNAAQARQLLGTSTISDYTAQRDRLRLRADARFGQAEQDKVLAANAIREEIDSDTKHMGYYVADGGRGAVENAIREQKAASATNMGLDHRQSTDKFIADKLGISVQIFETMETYMQRTAESTERLANAAAQGGATETTEAIYN